MSTPFQQFLKDAMDIALYICGNFRDRCVLPLPHSPAFNSEVDHAIMHYLASWVQSDDHPKTSIYRFAQEHYGDADDLDYIQRRLYWNRNQMLKYRGEDTPEKHDDADLLAIQKRMEQKSSLTDLASRGHIHHANYVSNARLAQAYQLFDDDYAAAAECTDDEAYLINTIHFYRIEQTFAFSLIAQIAQSMKDHDFDSLDPSVALAFWGGSHVENLSHEPMQPEHFFALPDVLNCQRYIPIVLSGSTERDYQFLLRQEQGCRTLEANVFERLPLPTQKYGSLDPAEIAAFLHDHYPLLERHVPVSFYHNGKPDYQKLRLLRYVFKQFYTTTS